jgi:hypothetical protein
MLTAIQGGVPDYVPLSFMLFAALRAKRNDWFGSIEAQRDLGLDAVADLTWLMPRQATGYRDAPGVPLHFPASVRVRQWKENPPGARYPVLHKEYATPDGALTVAVNQTDDWPSGDNVPLFDDFLVPRCTKYLVTGEEDLPALRCLLGEPLDPHVQASVELWLTGKKFAQQKGILLAGGWGVGADALGWLCGLQNAVLFAVDRPDFLNALLDVISEWNRRRMALLLDTGLDLFIRRAWYEGTAYWSPDLFRRFLLPRIQEEVELAHQAGARYGYILSVGGLQFVNPLLESGIDVLIGVDPVQDHGMNMATLKAAAGDELGLWGGINGFVTVERGSPDDVRCAVRNALDALGPSGVLLSPVDNVCDKSDRVWQNVLTLIETWKEAR